MKNTLLTLFGLLLITSATAQITVDYKKRALLENANFNDIVAEVKSAFLAKNMSTAENKKARKQFNRWVFHWQNKVNPDGSFPSENQGYFNVGILNEDGTIANFTIAKSVNSAEAWNNVGPQQSDLNANGYPNFPQMGRVNTLLRIKHPSNTNLDVLFVGAPDGGVWKSTDNGTTWAPKLDFVAGIGVTDIKTGPATTFANYTTEPIYVSTGDYDGDQSKSIGVLKSTNGGETFNSTGLSFTVDQQRLLGDLIVIDANTVFVGESTTIKKTLNGGTTWTDAYTPPLAPLFLGRAARSGNQIMYTDGFGSVFYTSDYTNDANWTQVNPTSDNGNKAAVTVDGNGDFYRQDQTGQIQKFNTTNFSFSNQGTIPPSYNSQGGYNQALIITNDLILSGEVGGQTSTNSGNNWSLTLNGNWTDDSSEGSYLHSDNHRLGRLDDPLSFWSAHDGGLSFITYPSLNSTKPTVTYKSPTVIVTQSYSVSINPTLNDDAYMMANQDNDSFSKFNGTWYAVRLGDGIQSAINYNNPNIRYAAGQDGVVGQSNTGFQGQLDGNGNKVTVPGANFFFPFEIHTTKPNTLYAGGSTDVHKLDATTGLTIAATNSGLNAVLKTIATHGNSLMAATDNNIAFSPNEGTSWTPIVKPAAAIGNITSVEYDGSNNQIMYLTVGGYTSGSKVFKSIDGGANWINISGNLPNIVMNEVLLKQNQGSEVLFAATELGVYSTTNSGASWSRLGQNLPNVSVSDIEIHYTADKLVAGTFGRGLWEINIANSTLGTQDLASSLEFSLYPNPTVNEVTVKVENPSSYTYQIYNVIGGLVLTGDLNNGTIDTSSLTSNIYMLRISNGANSTTKKLIIK